MTRLTVWLLSIAAWFGCLALAMLLCAWLSLALDLSESATTCVGLLLGGAASWSAIFLFDWLDSYRPY